MAKLYLSEYAGIGLTSGGGSVPVAPEPALVEQVLAVGSQVQSTPFTQSTEFIRVHTDAICSILIGTAPTATVGNKRMAADQTEYFAVVPGHRLSVIANT